MKRDGTFLVGFDGEFSTQLRHIRMEESTVKHLTHVTKKAPVGANLWQDIVCYAGQFIADMLGAFGGASPILGYLTEKCDLPIEGDDTTA